MISKTPPFKLPMNPRSLEMTDLPPRHRRGFALVVTLSLMVLLTVIAVGLLTMSSSTTRSSNSEQTQAAARANAKIGLMLALSELQKAAGPDQRITSQADIYDKPPAVPPDPTIPPPPSEDRKRWVGVWNTSAYSPATPDTKPSAFVRWLVSSNETTEVTTPPTTDVTKLSAASEATADTYVEIFKGLDATNSVRVPKVEIRPSTGAITQPSTQPKNYYAYWVEDEGVKADLGWKESDSTNTDERQQAARLSAAPGVDYGVFGGPFTSQVVYPITKNPSTTNPWLANIDKALSPADMPLLMSSGSHESNWLKSVRHDVTLGSRGVMADVKKGGLRRDLSLAFEMDGKAESPNTDKFNTQTSEFVGNGDTYSAPSTLTSSSTPPRPQGWPATVNERFLWRDYNGAGNPFSSSITAGNNAHGMPLHLRGPNWWALRDYANLYKRLSGTNGDYTMAARSYFPNRSSEGSPLSDYLSPYSTGETWDVETATGNGNGGTQIKYIYRPARANYAPVNLGTSVLVSMLPKTVTGTPPDQTATLAIALDPFFYLWNPYNRKISCENIAVVLGASLPGRVAFDVKKADGTLIKSYDMALGTLLANNGANAVNIGAAFSKLIFLIKGPIVLNPGEVVIATPKASGGVGTGEAVLGYAWSNSSGIIMTNCDNKPPYGPITVNTSDQVSFSFLAIDNTNAGVLLNADGSVNTIAYQSGTMRHEMGTYLPKGTLTPTQLAANTNLLGDQTQHNLQVLWAFNPANFVEDLYVSPEGASSKTTSSTKVRTETVSNMLTLDPLTGIYTGLKATFGAHSLLIKPASPAIPSIPTMLPGGNTPKPHEMFARFNPAPNLMMRDYYARCNPNQIYRHVTAPTDNAVTSEGGIDFSATARNTFWGFSYRDTGSTSVPASNIPSSPLFSIASFSDANLSVMGTDPLHAVGNSWSSPLISPSSAYGTVSAGGGSNTAQDFSWLINDALFDRYYLSGMAPAFTIGSGGYTATGTIAATLTNFFSANYASALANPVLRPYLPPGEAAATVVTSLVANDGYKKMGAYSLIDGAFNVNSTSVSAWTALLRVSRNLAITYAQGGGSDTAPGSPFPGSSSPSAPGSGGADPKAPWSGFARLDDKEISALATRIVAQVKLRGPFMSISDFINHKMGPVDSAQSYTGALQAALDLEAGVGGSGINADSQTAAAGIAPSYPSTAFSAPPTLGTGTKVTTGIPGDITQANLLQAIAPRLSARSDTFRIRSYGEVRSSDGNTILSQATCETIVQRVPEYVDSANYPWDEGAALSATNQKYGRRFRIVQTRWLTPNEL
jgi:hypothetical protein